MNDFIDGYTPRREDYYYFEEEATGVKHPHYLHCTGIEYRLTECERGFWSWGHYYYWKIVCKNGKFLLPAIFASKTKMINLRQMFLKREKSNCMILPTTLIITWGSLLCG